MAVIKGRGTSLNPANRFERLHFESDGGANARAPATELLRDDSKTILAENDSPDLDFRFSLNPYRGCEHGCIYCYARPSHEFLSASAGLDFETRIFVKENAAALLRQRLASPRWQPAVIAMSGNTDCYQPCERDLGITRACLEVLADFRNPVGIVTKSALVCRDIDLLAALAEDGAAQVHISITTLDTELARKMEPRATSPSRRLEAIHQLALAGVPVAVMAAPIIPGLNDHEIPAILESASAAGAQSAAWTLLRLAPPLDVLFTDWLAQHYPNRHHRILHRIRECRAGALTDPRFRHRMRGGGAYAAQIATLFDAAAKANRLDRRLSPPNLGAFRRPPAPGQQLTLL